MKPIDPKTIELLTPQQIAYWRAKTPAERVHLSMIAGRVVRGDLRSLIQDANPDWTDAEVAADLTRRILLGDEWIENNQDLLGA